MASVYYGGVKEIYPYSDGTNKQSSSSASRSELSALRRELEAARREQEEAAAARKAAYTKALQSTYDTSLAELGQNAASANTSAYVQNQQALRKLPQQSALLGTGGLSESSLMGLNASYDNNLNNIETERARGQLQLKNQLAQGIAAGEGQYADTMASIGSNYSNYLLNLSMQAQADEMARNQALQAQANWEREFEANQAQLGITNALNQAKFDASLPKSGGYTNNVKIDRDPDPDPEALEWDNTIQSVAGGGISRSMIEANRQYYESKFGKNGYYTLLMTAVR